MQKKAGILLMALLMAVTVFAGCAFSDTGNPNHVKLDPKNPTTVTVWHYYNGAQQDAFNDLIEEFNNTVGREQGIIVEGFSQGNVLDLENNVLDAVSRKVGAGEIPNIFAAYADTAYTIDKLGLVVDLSPYFTEVELSKFIDSYIEEGKFSADGVLKIFPIAKATEIFMLNQTDWDKFATATNADLTSLSTIEGITKTAKAYYEWTDSLTSEKNDGKAFFGRDAMANYFFIGSKQLGTEIFSVKDNVVTLNFDKGIMKKLWDNYYIPYVNGYFSMSGSFRSDDIKTGEIIATIGSSSGATFFPSEVIRNDEISYPIEMRVMEYPHFEQGESYAIQQGAGMVVTHSNDTKIFASIQFLKWFTEDEQNIKFSIASGYLPVTKAANNIEKIENSADDETELMYSVIEGSIDTVNNNTLYTPKAFKNGTIARAILEDSILDKAVTDRAIVVQNLNSGMSLAEAVSAFDNDSNFNTWFDITKKELEKIAK